MEVPVENSEVLNARCSLSIDDFMLSSSNHNGSDTVGNDSVFYEKFLLDEVDSYMDDLNSRLTVSRMVSDSVIKGMVNAVVEEASENIASKEAEIAVLNKRLQHYDSSVAEGNRLDSSMMMPEASRTMGKPERRKTELYHRSLNEQEDCSKYLKHFGSLEVAAQDHLQMLKEELRDIRSMISLNKINPSSSDIELCSIQGKTIEKLHIVDGYTDALEVILAALCEQAHNTCSTLKASRSEHEKKWEQEFQREFCDIIIQNFIRELQDEFETRISEKKSLMNTLNKNLQKMVEELSTIHQELDAIAKPFFSSDFGPLVSHYGPEGLEEWNTRKRKDHHPWKFLGNHHMAHPSHCEENGNISEEKSGESVNSNQSDSPQLKCMSNDELITYYKTEMTKMKRQHDLALQEKTEELFSLKREFLNEYGSNPSHRKDREFELLRKKVVEFISKLNNIILESEKLPTIHDESDMLLGLKERIDTILFENRWLQILLEQKREEAYSPQVSNETNQTSQCSSIKAKLKLSEQIKELKLDIEDVTLEATIRDEIQKTILREWVGELIDDRECLELESRATHDTNSTIYKNSIEDAISNMNDIVIKCYKENISIAAVLLEKDKLLCLETEENNKLKQEIASLSTLMKEKERFALETESKLMQQKKHFDSLCCKVNMLRDQVCAQDLYILECNKESDSVKGRLDETLQQVHQYEVQVAEHNQKLKFVSDALEEAEKQKNILQVIVEEKQKTLASAISKEEEHKKLMESMVVSMMEFSKAILDGQCRLARNLETNESRIKMLSHQCGQLVQQANFVKQKALWYKQGFEKRCSDLQKAETEVDLLGDEVDALLRLLEKIYIALEHYSPVLQHYPGVVEILKLIRREMKREY